MKYTKDYSSKTDRLKEAIDSADAIVIGAGAGLSTSAGFIYTGERLEKYFSDFSSKYGFKDMYTGGFVVMECCPEEMWAIYACINFGNAGCPAEIRTRSICIDGDIGEVLRDLL